MKIRGSTYKRKRKTTGRGSNCRGYTADAMRRAYESVKSGLYTGRKAAAQFKVPYGTLNKKLSGRAPVEAFGAGRPIEISPQKEQKISDYLCVSGKYGYGYNRGEMRELVAEFVRTENIKTRWIDGRPGIEWLKNFLKRHPEVEVRKDEHSERKEGNPFVVDKFYDDLEKLYENEGVAADHGHRLYNVTEISFAQAVSSGPPNKKCKTCPPKEIDCVDNLTSAALICIRGDGSKLPPLLVFPGRCVLPSCIPCKSDPGATYTVSGRGWPEGAFSYWFANVFLLSLPSLEQRNGESVILFYDGRSLRANVQVLALAVQHNVILVKFPPKMTIHLQPMDRTCLSALKSAWEAEHDALCMKNLAISQKLFAELFGLIWSSHFGKRIAAKGFLETGIYPLDRYKFDTSIFPVFYTESDDVKNEPKSEEDVKDFGAGSSGAHGPNGVYNPDYFVSAAESPLCPPISFKVETLPAKRSPRVRPIN